MNLLKISGAILLIAGLILAIKPDLPEKFTTPIDPYHMIEKRVKWGVLIGLGGLLLFDNNWTSWAMVATTLLSSLTIGIIITRLIGFVLDGFFIKQLYWLLIEFAFLLLFGFLSLKQKH